MQIENGWFSLRVVGTNSQGETETFHSNIKYLNNDEELKQYKKEYLQYLVADVGVKECKITHVNKEDAPNWSSWCVM